MISFPNIVKASEYRLEADEACLRARIAGSEVSVPWDSIQELSFGEHEAGMLSVGYVRLVGTDGKEIAWTDHKLALKADKSYWEINTFQVPRSDEGTIPLLSVERGLLLASIVIERAGLVERTDGIFVRPDAMEAPVEDTAGREHESPDDVLQKVSSASKRVKQVLLLLAGFAAASWLWGVHFAIALLVYLMIHEYGHVVAMKWCGVRVSGIFVLPFMGAVAVSEEEASTHWKAFLIAYMGPVFGAAITLVAAIALFATRGQTPILRDVAFSWAAISLFNLLPLGVLDGGRIVMSISFSTHRAVGVLASVGTALLCVFVALSLKSWLLGLVAFAAFMEMIHANSQHKLVHRLTKMGCDSEKIRKALLACWERLGRVGAEGSRLIAKRAQNAKLKVGFLRLFLSGKLETPKMTLLQIVGAIALYLGLFVFFVTILALASGMKASVTSPKQSIEQKLAEEKLYKQTKIAFVSNRDGNDEIYIMNPDGSGQRNLTNNLADDRRPNWLPDGRIRFESNRDGRSQNYVINAGGSGVSRWPVVSRPDEKKVQGVSAEPVFMRKLPRRAFVFNAIKKGGNNINDHEIYTIDPHTGDRKRLTKNRANDWKPSLSPDGKKIVFESWRGGGTNIYVMNVDGSDQTRLTNNRARNSDPSWSPDGKMIAYVSSSYKDRISKIYIMNADGSKQRRLTKDPADNGNPSWSPFLPSEPQLVEEPGDEQELQEVADIDVRAQAKVEPPEAESQQEEIVSSLPETSVDYFNRGLAYFKKGQYDQAISDFNKALEINPRDVDAYNNRGVAYKAKGQYDQAISDFNKALEIKPRLADAYNNRGNAYGKKGEYDRAISDFNKALEINPRYAEAYNNRGNAYGKKGEYDRAISDFNKALEINPRYVEAYNNRGIAYGKKGEYDQAISDFTKALEINPRYAKAYNNRGFAYYYHKGEYDRAISDFTKAIEINPRNAKAYNNRGFTYANKGQYDQAILDYTKAIEINPRDAQVYSNRGFIYVNKGQYDQAISDCNKAIEINPKYADAYGNRGVAYAQKGEYDQAILDLTKAIEMGVTRLPLCCCIPF